MSHRRERIIFVERTIFVLGGFVIVLVLLPFLAILLGIEPIIEVYHYENADGTFQDDEVPAKYENFTGVQSSFEAFKTTKGRPNDRLFRNLFEAVLELFEMEGIRKSPAMAIAVQVPQIVAYVEQVATTLARALPNPQAHVDQFDTVSLRRDANLLVGDDEELLKLPAPRCSRQERIP